MRSIQAGFIAGDQVQRKVAFHLVDGQVIDERVGHTMDEVTPVEGGVAVIVSYDQDTIIQVDVIGKGGTMAALTGATIWWPAYKQPKE